MEQTGIVSDHVGAIRKGVCVMNRPLLSDEAVEYAMLKRETLQCSFTYVGGGGFGTVEAEIIGPTDNMWFGYSARGTDKETALRHLRGRIAGFIGTIVCGQETR